MNETPAVPPIVEFEDLDWPAARVSSDGRLAILTADHLPYYAIYERCGPEMYTGLMLAERTAAALAPLQLRDDERRLLADSERCQIASCGHLKILHDFNEGGSFCPLCDCDRQTWLIEHSAHGDVMHVPASRATTGRHWCQRCNSSYYDDAAVVVQ